MIRSEYPTTRKSDHVDVYHGIAVPDPYRWLEDLNSDETQAWVEAQNEVTFDYLSRIPARERIERRLTELWDYPKVGAPFKRGGRYFQYRNTGLQNQDVLYTMSSPTAEGLVLIDPNKLSEDGTIALSDAEVSWDGAWVAYATSQSGSDWKTWHVRNVDTGKDLPDVIEWSKFSGVAWLPDNSGFFYGRYAAPEAGAEYAGTNYDQELYLHRLNTDQDEDLLIYARPDEPTWGFEPIVTDDGSYLVLHIWQGTDRRNRVFLRRLTDTAFIELVDELEAGYDFLGNVDTQFYFLTDLDAPKGKVVGVDVAQTGAADWEIVIPEADDTLQHVEIVHDEFVSLRLHDAHHVLHRNSLEGAPLGEISLPTLGAIGTLNGRPQDDELFYTFNTFTMPTTVFRFDFATGQSTAIAEPTLAFDASPYVTEQVFATSKDGTRVPLFLVHRRDWTQDRQNPTLLYGYGGFNIPITPSFSVSRLVWLEMGGVVAVANLRGGGEYGETWHEAGTVHNKQNVFDDFIACAEYLIESDITSTPKLAIEGRSNGGLLVGACLTQRPDLFGATLPTVGVMDMLRFHKFTIGWAWVSDYGSSDDAEEFTTLLAYSPVHNAKPAAYPPTLISTGDHDDRVMPAHSYKFAAALQAAQQGEAPILIRIQTKTGHGAGKPTRLLIEECADMWAFLVDALKIE